jgi:hypothetical protein
VVKKIDSDYFIDILKKVSKLKKFHMSLVSHPELPSNFLDRIVKNNPYVLNARSIRDLIFKHPNVGIDTK